jgi:hypothetical protein
MQFAAVFGSNWSDGEMVDVARQARTTRVRRMGVFIVRL